MGSWLATPQPSVLTVEWHVFASVTAAPKTATRAKSLSARLQFIALVINQNLPEDLNNDVQIERNLGTNCGFPLPKAELGQCPKQACELSWSEPREEAVLLATWESA